MSDIFDSFDRVFFKFVNKVIYVLFGKYYFDDIICKLQFKPFCDNASYVFFAWSLSKYSSKYLLPKAFCVAVQLKIFYLSANNTIRLPSVTPRVDEKSR